LTYGNPENGEKTIQNDPPWSALTCLTRFDQDPENRCPHPSDPDSTSDPEKKTSEEYSKKYSTN
jgi:hypothetical protein